MNKLINYSKHTLDKREKAYREKGFKIKFSDDLRNNTIEGIINKLYNSSSSTLHIDNTLHCRRGCRRSVIDGYLLCLHYLPEITFYEFYTELKERYNYSKELYLKSGYVSGYHGFNFCNDVRRLVFDKRFKIEKAPTN